MQFARGLNVFKEYSYLLTKKHLECSVVVGLWVDVNSRDYICLSRDVRDVLVQWWTCEWYSSAVLKSERDVCSSLSGWEMCEEAWRSAMGLERQWLQAVTTAVAICLLSKYANANMDHCIHLQCITIIHLVFWAYGHFQQHVQESLTCHRRSSLYYCTT